MARGGAALACSYSIIATAFAFRLGVPGQNVSMDLTTERRWRSSEPPFDGVTICTELLPPPLLFPAAVAVVEALARQSKCEDLRTFLDWHEHDGYISEGAAATWSDLRSAVQDERAMRNASSTDDYVRRAWLAEDGSFYLRWWWYEADSAPPSGPDGSDPVEGGTVDLTASAAIIEGAAEALAKLGVKVHERSAGEFFASGAT